MSDQASQPADRPQPLMLVTGATDGIGLETAFQLARLGARVLVHGRTDERAAAAVASLRERLAAAATGASIAPIAADLSSLAEVRALAARINAEHRALDVLVNNAGVYVRRRTLTVDNLELTLAVNHVAPFLLTHLLLPVLEASGAGRVVNVASVAHVRARIDWTDLHGEQDYDDYTAYAQSKLAMVMATVELARRLGKRPVAVNAVHPGVVSTKLLREGFGMDGPDSVTKGAATSVYLSIASDVAGVSGRYFAEGRPARMHPLAGDPATTSRLYAISAKLAGIPGLPRAG